MHNAHIIYKFKEGQLDEGIRIWKEAVLDKIKYAEGFVRVQLYTSGNEMMAIGTWEDKIFSEKFMRTGVFKDIMKSFGDYLEAPPINRTLEMRYFEEK
jgi:quinol monooxygenase YgiN